MRVVVTGADGFLGWHACARLHAMNCAARVHGKPEPVDLVRLDRAGLNDAARLAAALVGADAILHFAGVNRGADSEVETANPVIAGVLTAGIRASGGEPHVVYANSTHTGQDTPYGRSKARAGAVLAGLGGRFTDLVMPHIFGEGARPGYNNVTATLVDYLHRGTPPLLDPSGKVELLHAGEAVQAAINAVLDGRTGRIAPRGRPLTVEKLWAILSAFHRQYSRNTFPDLSEPFDLTLFNAYRAGGPDASATALRLNSDYRGSLFEAAKGGGGQVFLSWTKPGATRGDHFHLAKMERFVVVQGRARIRLRKVLSDRVQCLDVSGAAPAAVDIPTLHTHSIENSGDEPLLTLFWTHEIFDPSAPDTYSDPVMRDADETAQDHDHSRNAAGDHPPVACYGAA